MYHVSLVVQCKYGWSDEGCGDGDGKEESELEKAFDSMGMEINVGKSKVLAVKQDLRGSYGEVRVSGKKNARGGEI